MSTKKLAEITRLSSIVSHFDQGVRGIGVAIDLTHDPDRGAAGWIKSLEIDGSSSKPGKKALWAKVDWTEMGKEIIKLQTFKYISAEFGRDIDGETKTVTDDVLIAATLTNRPFVKGMLAVELDENGNPPTSIEILREGDFFHQTFGDFTIKAEETQSFISKIVSAVLNTMGREIPEAGTDGILAAEEGVKNEETQKLREVEKMDQIRELLVELGVNLEEDADVMEVLKDHINTLSSSIHESEIKLDEVGKGEIKALTEAKAKTKKLEEEKEALSLRVIALEEVNRTADREAFLGQMIREGKLRPADKVKFEELYDVAPNQVRALLGEGEVVVDLGDEAGSDSDDSPDGEDDADLRAAKALAAKDGISLEEAYAKVIVLGEGE